MCINWLETKKSSEKRKCRLVHAETRKYVSSDKGLIHACE